jgi:hypothetical protein
MKGDNMIQDISNQYRKRGMSTMELNRKRTAYAIRVAMLEVHDPQGLQRAEHFCQRKRGNMVFTAAAPQQERTHPPIPVMPGIMRGIDNKAPMVMMKLTTDVGLGFEGVLGQGYVMCVIAASHKYP